MKEIISKLNKTFDSRIRLGIMSILMVNDQIDFKSLKDLLDISDGNLASHLSNLEKKMFIEVKKQFIGRKPNTNYHATDKGRQYFKEHLDNLSKLIDQQNT